MRITRTNYAIGTILVNGISVAVADSAPVIILILLAIQIYLTVGRLKDMGKNPWWAITIIIPFVAFILMFPKGSVGANQYGEDPRNNK